MLYDRPYMRQPQPPRPSGHSAVTILLVVTVGVFVLQQLLNVLFPTFGGRDNPFMGEWFALSADHFRELKVWTILSYSFLHSTLGFMHILGNMLGLFFIGRMLEPLLGKRQFLNLYLGGAIFGGLVYLAVHHNGAQTVVGASAAVFAILTFFCLLRPEQPITLLLFFIIPVTVKPKWVFWGSLGVSLIGVLFYEWPARSAVAHSAHLGGILAGILYFRFVYKGQPFFVQNQNFTSIEPPEWMRKKKPIERELSYKVNFTSRDEIQEEVDRILDKINVSGFQSLSEDEKSTLDRARDLLNK